MPGHAHTRRNQIAALQDTITEQKLDTIERPDKGMFSIGEGGWIGERIRPSQIDRGIPVVGGLRLGVVDADPLLRDCIANTLRSTCENALIASFSECNEVLQDEQRPEVIVFRNPGHGKDPGSDGIFDEPFRQLIETIPTIILSPVEDPEAIRNAFEQGVRGYIPTRNASVDLLVEIVRLVKAGGTFVPLSGLRSRAVEDACGLQGNLTSGLTSREMAVLKLLKSGKPNKIIAYELNIAESTVKIHVRSMLKKLNVSNRTALVCRAYVEKIGGAD